MLRAARADEAVSASCLLALAGIEFPTPAQAVGARIQARAYTDLHILALGKNRKED